MSPSSAAWKPSSASSNRFTDAPAMLAVRESLPWSLAALAAGLLIFLALHLPIASALLASFAPASAVLAVVLAMRLAGALKLNRWITVPASVAVFALMLPQPIGDGGIAAYCAHVGGSGLFIAMIACLCVALATAAVRRSAAARIADAAVSLLAVVAAAVLLTLHVSVGNGIIAALQPLAQLGDTWTALVIITAVETVLWTFGIHGPATLAAIVTPVYLALQLQNASAFTAHHPLPHIVVVATFLFVFPGGAGATLPVAVLFCLSKIERLRTLGRVTIVPAIFNINEPLIFGTPLVVNPYFAVPFTLVPVILGTVTWLAMNYGFVSRPAFYVPSTVPSLVSTYVATLDWRAPVLMLVNIAIATAVYWPFVRMYERSQLASKGPAVVQPALEAAQADAATRA